MHVCVYAFWIRILHTHTHTNLLLEGNHHHEQGAREGGSPPQSHQVEVTPKSTDNSSLNYSHNYHNHEYEYDDHDIIMMNIIAIMTTVIIIMTTVMMMIGQFVYFREYLFMPLTYFQ